MPSIVLLKPRASLPDVSKPLAVGELIGRVDIPRLKLSAAVAEGDDDKTLGKAVGPSSGHPTAVGAPG